MTLIRTRIVVVPTIRLPARSARAPRVFQRMLTAGSSACVPESSMVMVLARAARVQIMLNAQAKKKAADRCAVGRIMAHSTCRERRR